MLTADENIVDVQFSVQYKVKDPVAWVFNNRDQVDTVRAAPRPPCAKWSAAARWMRCCSKAATSWPAMPSA
jgi:endonuclease V-like protein UPF0215 family